MNALRTLIVEDDAMIAGLLAETLEGLGHGVLSPSRPMSPVRWPPHRAGDRI